MTPWPAIRPVLPRTRTVFLSPRIRCRRGAPRATPLLLVALLGACGGDARQAGGASDPAEAPAPVVDATGDTLALSAPPTRIVSLVPSVTDLLLAMGAGDRLIARTDFDEAASLDTLPSVGQGLTPNLEWLVARRPDLVVAWPDAGERDVVERLRELGVPVYGARLESVASVLRTSRDLGAMLALPAGDSVARSIEAGLDSVSLSVRGLPRPLVLYVLEGTPPYGPGADTFADELLGIAGGENLLAALGSGWLQVSLEEVVRRRPDVIVLQVRGDADGVLDRLKSAPGWRDLDAVREGRVVALDARLFDRPGPRLPAAAAQLARAIHPELR